MISDSPSDERVGQNEAQRGDCWKLSPARAGVFASRKQSLFRNAAVGNHHNRPRQAPWLAELFLPATTTAPSLLKKKAIEPDRFQVPTLHSTSTSAYHLHGNSRHGNMGTDLGIR